MSLIKFTLFLFLIFSSSIFAAEHSAFERWDRFLLNPEHVHVVELALQSRLKAISEEEMGSILGSTVTDLTQTGDSFRSASLSFFHYLYGEDVSPNAIELQGFTDYDERSLRDKVILFQDKEGNPLVVMKWFKLPSHFLWEISAMEILHSLNLSKVQIISPLAIGQATYQGKHFFLLVETAAKGETISSYIDINPELSSSERREKLDLFNRAIAAHATALAELHLSSESELHTEQTPIWDFDSLAETLSAMSPTLSIDDLVPTMEELAENYNASVHKASFTHGDAHWGNFLYDAENSEITMIDVNYMHFSIDDDGSPKGDAAGEYAQQLIALGFLSSLYTVEEHQQIIKSFDESYRKEIGNKGPAESELIYSQMVAWIMNIKANLEFWDQEKMPIHLLERFVQSLRSLLQAEKASLDEEISLAAPV